MSNAGSSSAVRIRRATPADADLCGRICYEAFGTINRQHNFPSDIPTVEVGIWLLQMLFSHQGFYCVVAETEGEIVGSNCLDERSTVSGIGPITIAPGTQNRGIGRMLMRAVMDRSRERGAPGARLLQAAFHNRSLSLYTKLGFDVRELVSVLQGPAIQMTIEGCTIRSAREDDLEAANRVCESVHGHNRAGELREAIAQGKASVVERHGRITGYASEVGFFGHSVGELNLDLQALLAAADSFSGPGILVPARNAQLFRWCLEHGLKVMYPMTLMTTGLYNEPMGAYLPSVLY